MRTALALALALCAVGASALYEPKGAVLQASASSFSKVTSSKVPIVVEFFAPWCGHCKSLVPAYTAAAEKLQGIVPFVAVDCDKESNKGLCGQYGVQGFPTIKLFTPGSASPTDYQGPRSAKAIAEAAVGLLTTKHLKIVKDVADAQRWIGAHPGLKVLLVTDKARVAPMAQSLSQRFSDKGLRFAQYTLKGDAAETAALGALGVRKPPTLLALKGTDLSKAVLYEGELKAPRIADWIRQQLGGLDEASGRTEAVGGSDGGAKAGGKQEKQEKEAEQEQQQQGKKESVPAEIPQVVANVTAAELARRLEKEGVAVVTFFAGGEGACREHLNKLNAAVAGLHGLASGVQVDLTSPGEAAAVKRLHSIELPALGDTSCSLKTFLLPFDPEDHEDADEWRAYTGPLAARDLHKAALELFPAAGISPVTDATHREWLSADALTRGKVLLFTDKEEPPALFRALSANFRGYRLDFGLAHKGEAELAKQFNLQKTPSLFMSFPKPKPDGTMPKEATKDVQFALQPYTGPLKYGAIAGWLTLASVQLGFAPEDALRQFMAGPGGAGFGGASADAMVAEVADQESWKASCLDKGGVCIVAALAAGDSAAQAAQLEVLRGAAAGRGDQPLHFSWFAAGSGAPPANAAFSAALGLDAQQAPALVALAPKKQRTAVLTGRFEQDSVKEWLDGLLSGRVRTQPLSALPDFPAAAEGGAGSGGAGEEEAVEDEFSLDEIMKEEVAGSVGKGAARDEL